MDQGHLQDTLATLFELTRAAADPTSVEAGALARELGTSPTHVARALLRLEGRGLVDAGRVRLTMRGLAAAAALHANRSCTDVSLGARAPAGTRRPAELPMDGSPRALAPSSP